MTLISFFDEDPLDNIGDILFLNPDLCIFLGESSATMTKCLNRIRKLLDSRKLPTQVLAQSVPYGDMDSAKDVLTRLVAKYPDAILDVSGGSEMMISLAGTISETFDVPIYQRRRRSSHIHWQNGFKYTTNRVHLTVSEVVSLHCGVILNAQKAPKPKEELTRDIRTLWEVARTNMAGYNALCNSLSYLMKRNRSQSELELTVDPSDLSNAPYVDKELLSAMDEAKLIEGLSFENGGLHLRFRSYDMQNLVTKAGCLLEFATCIAAGRSSDSAVGVVMDWDGVVGGSSAQTRNELDVMLTYGMLPVCISCKNGRFDKEALYELDTVSRHFAGRFAKRILVASYVGQPESTVETLKQRAIDMEIVPLFNVQNYSFDEFTGELRKYLPRNSV